MSNKKQAIKVKKPNLLNRYGIIATAVILVFAAVLFIVNGNKDNKAGSVSEGSDVVISKSEITETVTFIPTKAGKTNMEIMAVKASDGTIRTAFNTCQICNGSPRAYYKQQGDTVVCLNCGNQFSMDMIEVEKGGCNPVPILKDDKVDDGDTITISKDFIAQNKGLFPENWKTK